MRVAMVAIAIGLVAGDLVAFYAFQVGALASTLIDVVLLLLVFFMVTTSFVRESSVSIRLPEASPEPTAAVEADRLEITITADNRYFVNNRELINAAPETLERALRGPAGSAGDDRRRRRRAPPGRHQRDGRRGGARLHGHRHRDGPADG